VFREEIIRALRSELGDVIEEKIEKTLKECNTRIEPYHCKSCTCDDLIPQHTAANKLNDSPELYRPKVPDHSHILPDAKEKRKQYKDKSFNNHSYHHMKQTSLEHTEPLAKLVKHISKDPTASDDSLICQSKLTGMFIFMIQIFQLYHFCS
jgi:hypothetical protein